MYLPLAEEVGARPGTRTRPCLLIATCTTAFGLLLLTLLPPTPTPAHRPSPLHFYLPATSHPSLTPFGLFREKTNNVSTQVRNHPDSSSTTTTPLPNHIHPTPTPTPRSTCSPIQKVGFAKTHKTASSTIQNVVFRWGLHSGWLFAMYREGSHLGPPRHQYTLDTPFRASWLERQPWSSLAREEGYNTVALHTMWDQQEVEEVLGTGHTVRYITILREPVDQFESLYSYSHFESKLGMGLEQFVAKYVDGGREVARIQGYLGRNQQLWDLGVTDTTNLTMVQHRINQLDAGFDLVMIAEQFEESLVLLSHQLCWPLANLTSLKLNARKASSRSRLSAGSRASLASWLAADYKLYNHFKLRLEERVAEVGSEQVLKGVAELKRLNRETRKRCVLERVEDTQRLPKDKRPWSQDVVGFRLSEEEDCKFLGMTEIRFIDVLRHMQQKKVDNWKLE